MGRVKSVEFWGMDYESDEPKKVVVGSSGRWGSEISADALKGRVKARKKLVAMPTYRGSPAVVYRREITKTVVRKSELRFIDIVLKKPRVDFLKIKKRGN